MKNNNKNIPLYKCGSSWRVCSKSNSKNTIDLKFHIKEELEISTQDKIDILFNNFKEFLKEKNKRYGDSALKPLQIFSKIDAGNQICNRIDDKLGRISKSEILKKNDVSDLFGYTALLLIEKEWLDFKDLLD